MADADAGGQGSADAEPTAGDRSGSRSRNYSWAQLMARVWAVDVLECPQCGGRLRVLAAIQSPEAIRKILDCLGLPSRAPPIARAAPPDDLQLEWA
jgi:hypothetical protein